MHFCLNSKISEIASSVKFIEVKNFLTQPMLCTYVRGIFVISKIFWSDLPFGLQRAPKAVSENAACNRMQSWDLNKTTTQGSQPNALKIAVQGFSLRQTSSALDGSNPC